MHGRKIPVFTRDLCRPEPRRSHTCDSQGAPVSRARRRKPLVLTADTGSAVSSARAACEMAWRLGKNRSCSISDLNVVAEAYIAVNHYYFHMGNEMFKRRPERITIHAHVSKREPQNRLRRYVLAPLLASSVTSDKSLSFRFNL